MIETTVAAMLAAGLIILALGTIAGVVLMCCMRVAGKADDEMDDAIRRMDKHPQ
jgi:hypothetical protein